ncbi:MAG: cyclic nucleotide-binding domain-containing protein [Magnetococcales bacterium]|nr:cyclic nucleotide-binding domain-containing protein [Magnetococcales bacterium]NGZ05099.1 cyclic nucleotide-binding domain-containing protein [Magnetococcales bacterium]
MLFDSEKPTIGIEYADGETILREGEIGDHLYVILEGRVEVVVDDGGERPFQLAILEKDGFFGEMSLFSDLPRVASVRALGPVRLMTLDKRGLLRWLADDPSLSLRIMLKMVERVRLLVSEVVHLRKLLRDNRLL